jgi:hypothetical protein
MIRALVEQLNRDSAFARITNNPAAQFGSGSRQYLGASLLPEVKKKANKYTENGIKYRTLVANDGTRYSPVQKKGGVIVGSFDVELGNSDIGSEFTGEEYDTLLDMLASAGQGVQSPEAIRQLLNWADTTINLPLKELNEKQRWEAIVDAEVIRKGDNKYEETVTLSNPTGHRISAADPWSDDDTDPYIEIMDMVDFLTGKGYFISRIFGGRTVSSKLSVNAKIRQRVGRISIASGTVTGLAGRASKAELDTLFSQDGLPPIEEYNLQYRTQDATGYFLKRDVLVFACTTGRDIELDFGDEEFIPMRDTLGYTGIGRPQGSTTQEVRTVITPYENKPMRIEGEGWQTSFPVITEPEAIGVIKDIT